MSLPTGVRCRCCMHFAHLFATCRIKTLFVLLYINFDFSYDVFIFLIMSSFAHRVVLRVDFALLSQQ